jgi:hypothetical protein
MNNDRFRFRTPYYLGNRFAGYEYWKISGGGRCEIERTDWQEWVRKSDPIEPRQDEQCTCLRDKNNNLIYEGDWIRNDDGHEGMIHYVAENQAAFYWGAGRNFTEPDELEVVGNVHTQEVKE